MKLNTTALVGVAAGSLGVLIGVLIPKPVQTYGLAVVTGTTRPDPSMQGYVEKVDALVEQWGCKYIARERNTLLMEGDGGPLTVVMACPGSTLQNGIDLYNSPEYQELVKQRQPFTDWDFRLVQGRF